MGKLNIEKMEAKRDVEGLIKALEDEYLGYLRMQVAEALGNIGDARAVEPLIEALKDSIGYVRTRAAEALGKIGDTRAVESLTKTQKDEDEDVRKAVKQALVDIALKESNK